MKTLVREVRDDAAAFWADARRGVLSLSRCGACGHRFHYPRLCCPACGGTDVSQVPASGRGTLYSYTIVRYSPFGNNWTSELPYCVVQVDLEEGVRMLSRLVEHDAATLRIGMPVEAVLVPADDGVNVVPCFRPAETAAERT